MKRIMMVVCLVVCSVSLFAQINSGDDFSQAKQFYQEKNYSAARTLFQNYSRDNNGSQQEDVQFYLMQCDLFLNKDGAEDVVKEYISKHPQGVHANDLSYSLALNYYDKKDYKNALSLFQKCNINLLNAVQQPEYYFKQGYCELQNGDADGAEQLFLIGKEYSGSYRESSLYYYGHCLFVNKKYDNARGVFESLSTQSQYAPLVPYYLSCIAFEQGNYDVCIAQGNVFLKQSNDEDRKREIDRLVGLSNYKKGEYTQAIALLQPLMENCKDRQDRYSLAVSYFMVNDYTQAILHFKKVAEYSDDLAQSSYLFMGNTYLKLNDKTSAKNAFDTAAKMDYDVTIKEQASYNFLKVSYEQASAGDQALLTHFQNYFATYPKSAHTEELTELLVLYLKENKQYETAYQLVLRMHDPSPSMKKAMQEIAYWRGVAMYEKGKYKEAIDCYSTSIKYAEYSGQLQALATYWRAESNYRLHNKSEAQRDYSAFLALPEAPSTDIYSMAYYSLGYCEFADSSYVEAAQNFHRFIAITNQNKSMDVARADAYNRVGDCAFLNRNFDDALIEYNRVIDNGVYGVDYALFQRAFIDGLNKNDEKKIAELKSLVSKYPTSPYADDALYEIGKTYANANQWNKAVASYDNVIENYSGGNLVSKALLQEALAYYNLNNHNQSKLCYQKIVEKFPQSDEAAMALEGLKNISVEQNDVASYVTYANKMGAVTVGVSEQDELTFKSAEKIYMDGDSINALQSLSNYLTQFPQGSFVNNAHFYRADCCMKLNKIDDALVDYKYILSKDSTPFTEDALLYSSHALFQKENYKEALDYYSRLNALTHNDANKIDARLGMLRCYYQMSDWNKVIDKANDLQGNSVLRKSDLNEIYFKKGKSELNLGQNALARNAFLKVGDDLKSAESAEAQFRIAQMDYKNKDFVAAEKRVNGFIAKKTPYAYWLAKNFLLLSDIYMAKGDAFQAKQYLLSLSENYKGNDDISNEVKQRLDRLNNKTGAE